MAEGSSRPRRISTRTVRRIIKVGVLRRWGPARIACLLGLGPASVRGVLARCRLAVLAHLGRAAGRVAPL
ncbi:hypothetical protein ABTX60_27405 [Streptomyces sp. NPDC126510]|uniref:hypothetical protein n=1 Tax=Streptomyces sp. NPDC126510 TaxID=3155317 RepID=UPI00332397FB